MIKITIIFIVVYLVFEWFTKVYVKSLGTLDTVRLSMKKYTKNETIWFVVVGLMKLLSVIFGAISVIILVFKWL